MILSTHGIVGSQIQSFVGLLDTYPNAAAAYSVRKLRTAYTGSAIRVRRSSDNTETDIGFSGANLDTSSLTSFCSGTNGFVTTWYDQSGNARNATQTTASNQPKIVNAGSVLVDANGKPRIQGNQSSTTNLSTTFSSSQPTTIFGVVNYTSLTSPTIYPYAVDLASSGNIVVIGYYNGAFIDGGASLYSTVSISTNTNYLSYGLLNTTSSEIAINTTLTTGNAGTANPSAIKMFNARGNDAVLNGFLSEVIIYPSNQSTNRTGISTNINTYYAIY
jgi:hypothetical protein